MKYGLIKNGVCVSMTETDNEKEAQRRAGVHGCVAIPLLDGFGVGSKYAKSKWIDPIEVFDAEKNKPITIEGVSEEINRLQVHLDLLKSNIEESLSEKKVK